MARIIMRKDKANGPLAMGKKITFSNFQSFSKLVNDGWAVNLRGQKRVKKWKNIKT
jgi:hypothetical protein